MEKEARGRLREIYEAPTKVDSRRLREAYAEQLRMVGQAQAAACLERDWEEMTAYFDFPQEHWRRLKTSNPIESVFAGVRLRTTVAKRMRVRENALYLTFKLVCRLSLNWRRLDGPAQIRLLLEGLSAMEGLVAPCRADRGRGLASADHVPVVRCAPPAPAPGWMGAHPPPGPQPAPGLRWCADRRDHRRPGLPPDHLGDPLILRLVGGALNRCDRASPTRTSASPGGCQAVRRGR